VERRVEEVDVIGNVPYSVLMRTDATGTASYLIDGLGSTVALTSATGAVSTEYTYEPFGKSQFLGPPTSNPFQFTGRENDGTGLYYYRARYYDPSRARFITPDPIRLAGGDVNLYGYVRNDPVNWVDPWGIFRYAPGAGGPLDVRTTASLECFEICLGRVVTVTGAREEGPPHLPGSAHATGEACDLAKNANPGLTRQESERCFNGCFGPTGYGQEEASHFHLQTRPGRGGATGFAPGMR